MSDNVKSEENEIVQSSVNDESAVNEMSESDSDDNKQSLKKKLQQGYSTTKEKKERGKAAAKTTGRKIVNESSKTKDAEMDTKGSNPVNVVSKLVKSAPLSAKVVVLGACLYGHNTKEMQKKYEKNMKEWQKNQQRVQASRNDTFGSAYERIMAQYALERLEKKKEKIQKRQERMKKVHGVVNRIIDSVQRGTQVMAQKQTANNLVGDTSGIERASMLAATSYIPMSVSDSQEMEV